MNFSVIKTKLGTLLIDDDGSEIRGIHFVESSHHTENVSEIAQLFQRQLNEYAERKRTEFDIPFSIEGTPFQRDVLIAMSQIKYGDRLSYSGLARKSGHPNAQRAVGSVCRKNHLPFLLPCHRVVSNNGIGKYSGSEEFKKFLLDLEQGA